MNISFENKDDHTIIASRISPPGFDVSWAGGNPWAPGYTFGSENGEIQFTELDPTIGVGPYPVAPSGDAVNGIAFAGDLMAVSTRSEVVFLNVPHPGEGNIERAVFYGGAHGVIPLQSGGVVAPLGTRGLLFMGPKQAVAQRVKVLRPVDEILNHYTLVNLARTDRGDVIACAARQSGFIVMTVTNEGFDGSGRRLSTPGVDFVDACPLHSSRYPLAAAGLGLDCSIHFTRDLLDDKLPISLRFRTIKERAYRILCVEGHILLLTSKCLHIFAGLATRFIDGGRIDGPAEHLEFKVEAVDAFLGPDRSLLMVMPDCVHRIEIDSLVAGNRHLGADSEQDGPVAHEALLMDQDNDEWKSFDESIWEPTEEFELAIA